jgi:prolyl-tRNA synthetase
LRAAASASEAGSAESGLFLVPWHDDAVNEAAIKEETKATLRCYPFAEQHRVHGQPCFYSGKPATHMALFARAY